MKTTTTWARRTLAATAALLVAAACSERAGELLLPTDGARMWTGSGAGIWTDKDDYAPGETVVITGVGFEPGETVRLLLEEEPAVHSERVWEVEADAKGGFVDTSFQPEEHHLGVAFTLTATGLTSGRTAHTTFTDDRRYSVTITPNAVAPNVETTYTLTITNLTANTSIGSIRISKPSNYDNFPTTPCAATAPGGWTIGTCTTGEIRLSTTTHALGNGQSVSIQVRATATSTGSSEWPIEVWRSGTSDVFNLWGDKARVVISDRAAVATLNPTVGTAGTQLYTLTITNHSSTVLGSVRIQKQDFSDFNTSATCAATVTVPSGWSITSCNTSQIDIRVTNAANALTNGQSLILPINLNASASNTRELSVSVWRTATTDQFQVLNPIIEVASRSASATISPTSVAAGASQAFTLTVTRLSSHDLGSARIAVPAGFTVTNVGTPTASSSKVWTASHDAVNNRINLFATNSGNRLTANNQWVQVIVTATAPSPSSDTNYEWTTGAQVDWESYGGGAFSFASQPFVTVTALVATAVATTTTLTANPATSQQVWSSVTFTAAVEKTSDNSAVTSGTVRFYRGGTSCSNLVDATQIGTDQTVNSGTGEASVSTSALAIGSYTIRACYLGVANTFEESEHDIAYEITTIATSTTLTAWPLSSQAFGSSVTFTATVTSGAAVPSGTVSFYTGGVSCSDLTGATQIGSGVNVVNIGGSGVAQVLTSSLSIGAHTIRACYTPSTNFAASSGTLSYTITAIATTTAVTVTPTTQQYSDRVSFKATISPTNGAGAPATGVTFKVGTQVMNATPVTLVAGTGADAGKLVAELNNVALLEPTPFGTAPTGQMQPGNRTVTAEFTGKNANFSITDPTTPLTINREDARVNYTGLEFITTSSASATSANVVLSATIQDISATADAAGDTHPGDIRNARVSFVNRDNGQTLCSNLTPSLVSAADTRTGTVGCTVSLSAGNTSGTPYTIGIVVNHYYTRNSGTDDVTVTVAQPINGMITGGGHLVNSASAGQYAGGNGLKTNFGFNVKYNKKMTSLQGGVNIIIRASDGKVYQIKSNSMNSLVTNAGNGTATFMSKANIRDITDPLNPISLGGNLDLQMVMKDNGNPGTLDTIGMTLRNGGGTLLFSSNWSGTQTAQQNLRGGNLVVR